MIFFQFTQSRHFIQLFRELSSEVHATIPKCIVGGFEGNVLPSKKFERMVREATDICLRVLKESNKSRFDSFNRYEQCIDHIPYYLSGLSRAFLPTTFLETAVYSINRVIQPRTPTS